MPALVKSRVGAPGGTSEELRTRRWPLASKKRKKVSRISLPDQTLFSCPFAGGVSCAPLAGSAVESPLTLSSSAPDYRRGSGGAPMRRGRIRTDRRREEPPPPRFFVSADSKGV